MMSWNITKNLTRCSSSRDRFLMVNHFIAKFIVNKPQIHSVTIPRRLKSTEVTENLIQPVYKNGRYTNPWPDWRFPLRRSIFKFLLQETDHSNIPDPKELDITLPVLKPDSAQLFNPPEDKIQSTWIGHASMLIQMGGFNVLTDPVFGNSVFPVPYVSGGKGFKRYRPAPLTIDELPQIDVVTISHSHYDHLDYISVLQLNKRFGSSLKWFVPKGLGTWFKRCGCDNVKEFGWWEKDVSQEIQFAFVPAQHWGRRTITDFCTALWGGWVMKSGDKSFYFTGDTSYCDVFKTIGRVYGPFTLAAITIGAYEPRWFMEASHVNPEEAVKIHRDVQSQCSIGIHWGTFRLAYEFYLEPREKLKEELKKKSIPETDFFVMKHGETILV